jgi:hypothetical protein
MGTGAGGATEGWPAGVGHWDRPGRHRRHRYQELQVVMEQYARDTGPPRYTLGLKALWNYSTSTGLYLPVSTGRHEERPLPAGGISDFNWLRSCTVSPACKSSACNATPDPTFGIGQSRPQSVFKQINPIHSHIENDYSSATHKKYNC